MFRRKNSDIRVVTAIGVMLLLVASPSRADQPVTNVDLQVSVTTMVMQDSLSAGLRYRVEGATSEVVQQQINEHMQKVWALAANKPVVEISQTGYRVWYDDGTRARHDRAGVRDEVQAVQPKWIGYQSLSILGQDFDAVRKLAGEMQALGLAMTYFGYHVSKELNEKTKNELMPEASRRLIDKARLMASAFDAKLLTLEDVTLGIRGDRYAYADMAESRRGDANERFLPVAKPKEEQISLSLIGRASITRVDFQ